MKGASMPRKRTVRIRFWLTDIEAEKLKCAVNKSGLSREAYIRVLINGLVPTDKPPPDFYQMMRELHSIGNNLNQIAQRAHTIGEINAARYEKNAAELDRETTKIMAAVFEHRKLE
jgi:hypothetical protein